MALFNTIKNKKEYWLVDQIVKESVSDEDYINEFQDLLNHWKSENVGYLSVLIEEKFENWLIENGFNKKSSMVEYTRSLNEILENYSKYKAHSLAEQKITDNEYAYFYDQCRSGSANKGLNQTIDEILQIIQSEFGEDWRKHCYYFTSGDEIIGIAVLQIEPGTVGEGRMFYFGIMPHMRGKGIAKDLHKIALHLLKQKFHATYYVGSTHTVNVPMIRIFERNGCVKRFQKGMYQIDFA